jgi:phosphatidylglycerophosphate synthase
MPSSRPPLGELRAVAQPPELLDRRSDEHWAGRLYMRAISIRVTHVILPLRVTPDQLTLLMMAVGLAAAAALAWPTVAGAVLAALLVQLYLLLDCVDGELARWRRSTSAVGVFLDRLGHYVVEASLVIGLGVRVSWIQPGGPNPDGWVVLGLVAALLLVLARLEGDLVAVARTSARLEPDDDAEHAPRSPVLRTARRVMRTLRFHRLLGAIELSLAVLVAVAIDAVVGGPIVAGLQAIELLLIVTVAAGAVVVVGHAATIVTSDRLR